MRLLSSPGTGTAAIPGTRRRLATLLTAALVAAPLLLAVSVTPASAAFVSVPGGPVVIDGNDPADHQAQTTSYIQRVYASLDANVAAGYVNNGQVAVIGSCKAMLDSMATGETFVQFNSPAEVSALFDSIATNNFKHLHICSDDDNTLSDPVQLELDKWGSSIVTHVNRGGGLFSTGHKYRWLNNLFPSLVTTGGGTSSSYVTAEGSTLLGLAVNSQVNAINHYTFTGEGSTPLKPLLTESTGGGGRRVAIGGAVVRFPQIVIDGPATSTVGNTESYALSAATADGLPLANSAFTYTITGPTTAATTTGTGTTDAQGNYSFSFATNARGTTKISVRFTLAGGTAAGSSSSTSWVSLSSAPNPLTAVNQAGSPGSVQLTWASPTSPGLTAVTDYLVQRSSDGGVTWTTVADGTSTATSYVVTGLVPTTAYTFRVAAVNTDGPGAWSNLASTLANDITFASVADQTFADGNATLVATATSGRTVSFLSNTPTVCTVSGDVVTPVAVGTCSVTATEGGDAAYVQARPVTRTFAIALSPSSITFPAPSDENFAAGTTTVSAAASSGLPVSFTSNDTAICTVSGNVVTLVAGGTCSLTATQDGDATYEPATPVTRTFEVLPAASSITFPAPSDMNFAAGTTTVSATASSGLPVSFTSNDTTICTVSGNVVTLVAGGTCSLTATQDGDATYEPATPVTRTFEVLPAASSITFPAPSDMNFAAGTTTVSATATSGLPVDFTSNDTTICTVSGNVVTLVAGGTCSLTATQDGDATYEPATPVTRTFEVLPAASSITFPALSDTEFAAGTKDVAATASSGLPVTFSSATPAVCTITGGVVTLVRAGTCSVTASQDGNASYEPAARVTRSFDIQPSTSQVRFPAIDDRPFSQGALTLPGGSTSGLALMFTSNTPAICTVSGDVVTPVRVGTCSVTASQEGDAGWLAAEAVTRTFRLLANDAALGTVTSTGSGPAAQTVTVPVPPGGGVTLIDGAGLPATTVTVPGEGTYTVDPASGAISFTPAPGYSGVATGVVFRVTSAVGQVATGRFSPTVGSSAGVRLGATSGAMVGRGATIPASCSLVGVNVAGCTVQVFVTLGGKKLLVGTGTIAYPAGAEPSSAVPVITLNALGRKLVRTVGGRAVSVEASVVPAGGAKAQPAVTTARLLPNVLRLHRPVFFNTDSAKLRPAAKKYLKALRVKLGPVRAVTCTGYADGRGLGTANTVLGKARATSVCRYLTRGLSVTRKLLTKGERAKFGSNATRRGKASNRRTMITLGY